MANLTSSSSGAMTSVGDNISHNNRGAMGYSTPKIDRIARDGVEFTDYYGQQSCTAGRAAFTAAPGAGCLQPGRRAPKMQEATGGGLH